MSLVSDSTCLGQMQLQQSIGNISHGFRWHQDGDWMNLSVCSMARSTQSPLEVPGMPLLGRDAAGGVWVVVMFLTSPWAEKSHEGFDLMDHRQPPTSAAPKGEEGGLRPALPVAPLQGKCGPVNCVLADDLLFMHVIYCCSPAPVMPRTWPTWVSKSFLNPSPWQA